ncbi:hypothetical protein [Massilia timonae]|uniref:hypothetical protein n=1 Tax=Massilia timonae TaxID=47229 RepID=UPI0028D42692|nr:hypothetical protein [Massilia timonae]
MRRRRTYRARSADSLGMTQADLDAIRNYRANRGSSRYYADLKAIDNKSPATQPDDTKK